MRACGAGGLAPQAPTWHRARAHVWDLLQVSLFASLIAFGFGCGSEKKITSDAIVGSGTGDTGGTSTGGTGGSGSCTPTCGSKDCGPDGCGGFCGICSPGTACTPAGACQAAQCQPKCSGKECGPDGCGGFCGECPSGTGCNGAGVCVGGGGTCTPKCSGKECGDDGCGNLCGKCAPGKVCDESAGRCTLVDSACGTIDEVGECQQDDTVAVTCKAGKLVAVVCDPDPAKALVCGFNPTKNKHDCIKAGCTPNCSGKQCGSDGCGGQCGQCKPTEVCSSQGTCTLADVCVPNCQGKVCGPDGCGGQCGLCDGDEVCSQGKCIDPSGCNADCAGKSCGSDGCGGTCGTCQPNQTCQSGQCNDSICTPKCANKSCGPDTCGGSCGSCTNPQTCDSSGHCVTVGTGECGTLTYEGTCDETGLVVKWCEGGSVKTQDCSAFGEDFKCSWIESQETYWCTNQCQAGCEGKECGDDGCGGNCGTCDGEDVCNGAGLCIPPGGGGECGDISYAGICEGTTLKYCSGDSLIVVSCGSLGKTCGWNPDFEWNGCLTPDEGECTPNCLLDDGSVKECGDDGCGNLCGVCEDGLSCNEGKCGEGGGSTECGDITIDGICEGDVLKYCVGDNLYTSDCAASGKVCGFDEGQEWYACKDATDDGGGEESPCGDLTKKGYCQGNVATYCTAQGFPDTADCSSFGLYCMYDPSSGGGAGAYDCTENPGCIGTCEAEQRCQIDGTCGCDGLTIDGHCEGQTLVYCIGDKITIEDCAAGDESCVFNDSGWAICQ